MLVIQILYNLRMVSERLASILRQKGLTQAQAGAMVGLPQSRISELLKGKKPTLEQFLALRRLWPEIDMNESPAQRVSCVGLYSLTHRNGDNHE